MNGWPWLAWLFNNEGTNASWVRVELRTHEGRSSLVLLEPGVSELRSISLNRRCCVAGSQEGQECRGM